MPVLRRHLLLNGKCLSSTSEEVGVLDPTRVSPVLGTIVGLTKTEKRV